MPTRTLVSLALLLTLAVPLAADDAPPAALLDWGKQFLGYCPDESFELEEASVPAPAGFTAWTLHQKSSWGPCAQRTTLFGSSDQAIVGRAFPLSADPRPLEAKIAERARPLLGKDVTVTLEKAKLQDGLKRIRLDYATPEGPLTIGAYLDKYDENLVIGVLGKLGTDPARELLQTLSKGAATRGKAGSKIVILEVSDLQCPGCATIHANLEPFVRKHLDEIEYRRVDLPLFEQHDWTLAAAAGGKAIQKIAPAAYWDYIDYIFQRQADLTAATIDTAIEDFAEGKELDWKKIEREMKSPAVRRALVAQVGTFFGHGIFGTPTILVNGRIIPHAGSGLPIVGYLEEMLKK
ncbi:MAG TPA: thioredoxin domain-containing protein [Thermoanaerobaculia bacterium]|nr:thioredoxin domain-containing protein [Thermoanaerobaculia bacterium]